MADRKKTNSLTEQDTAPVAMLDGEEKVSIDQASAEAFIAEKRIGERIKRLRLKKSMGLVELGRQTGLSASFLSQLETGRVVPTLRNLARVSIVFGKDLSYFFEAEPQAMFRIHRKKERMRMPQTGVEDPSYYFESLGYMVPDRQLDPYFAEFLPRKAGDVRPHVHPGFEFLYILEGELEIRHADKVHILEAGDGVYFDASTPHSYRCNGATATQVIIVTMHQQQAQQAQNTVRPMTTLRGTSSASGLASRPSALANGTHSANAANAINATNGTNGTNGSLVASQRTASNTATV
jgi:transcriptional regulator with XRE-family HTH domain